MLSNSLTYVALHKAVIIGVWDGRLIIGVWDGRPIQIAASYKDFSLDRDIQTESKTHTASVLPRAHREMSLIC